MTPRLVHLVRHGEVANQAHLVYADLPGFRLSERGLVQARAASARLASAPIAGVWSSPLERALQTATAIAEPHRLPVRVLDGLVEWGLLHRWRGIPWEEVPTAFPGELEAYLDDPRHLPPGPETLAALAQRVTRAVEVAVELSGGTVVVVGHQDPLQAAVRGLAGLGLDDFHRDKPGHGEIISLEGSPWRVVDHVVEEVSA